jgi:hypothetical protein
MADVRGLRAPFGRPGLLAAALARRGDLCPGLDRSTRRTGFGVGLGAAVAACTRATGPGAERQPGTTWPEVERAADSTLTGRRSGTVGTDIEATAEPRLTADRNSARSDLESSAIFAGTDSDYGGIDRRLIRVVAWIAVVILVVAIAKSAVSGIGGRDAAAYQQACSNHAGACEKPHNRLRHDTPLSRKKVATRVRFSHIRVNFASTRFPLQVASH